MFPGIFGVLGMPLLVGASFSQSMVAFVWHIVGSILGGILGWFVPFLLIICFMRDSQDEAEIAAFFLGCIGRIIGAYIGGIIGAYKGMENKVES